MTNKTNFSMFLDQICIETISRHSLEVWQGLIHKIQEAEDEMCSTQPRSFAFSNLRVSLESLLKLIYPDQYESLFDKLKKLDVEYPSCRSLPAMHRIRVAGNKAAHDVSVGFTRIELGILLESMHKSIIWCLDKCELLGEKKSFKDFDNTVYLHELITGDEDADLKVDIEIKSNTVVARDGARENNLVTNPADIKKEVISNLMQGKHFVNSPPGTGKTHLLVNRLRNSIGFHKKEEIICLTFTNRAAKEMRDRVEGLAGSEEIFIGNIHSFCIDILGEKVKSPSMLDDSFTKVMEEGVVEEFIDLSKLYLSDSLGGLDEFINHTGLYVDDEIARVIRCIVNDENRVVEFRKLLSSINSQAVISHYLTRNSENIDLLRLASEQFNIFKDKLLLNVQILNFTDSCNMNKCLLEGLIFLYLDLLVARKEAIRCYSFDDLISYGLVYSATSARQFSCVQVDECQDLNAFQWALIKNICTPDANVMVFGDVAQSIYSFMGAQSEIIADYTKNFELHSLGVNYRSNNNIVKLLNRYRQENLLDMFLPSASSRGDSDGPSSLLLSYKDEEEEARSLVVATKKIIASSSRNVGVLLRTNNAVDEFTVRLNESGINAYRLGSRDIMKSPCFVDFLSFIKTYSGRGGRLDWYRLFYRFNKSTNSDFTKKDAVKIVDELFSLGISPSYCLTYSGGLKPTYQAKRIVDFYRNRRVIVFDTETTNKDVDKAELLQLAAVSIEGGRITEKFNQFIAIDPKDTESPRFIEDLKTSSEIHNIDMSILKKNGRDASCVFDEFLSFIGEGESIIVAHNSNYDISVLERNIDKLGSQYQLEKFLKITRNNVFDTLSLSRMMYPNLKNHKLETLLKEFDLEGVNSHDALDDVLATSSLLEKLVEDIASNIDEVGCIISKNQPVFDEFNRAYNSLHSMFTSQSVNYFNETEGKKLRLSDLLSQWIEFCYAEKWYQLENFEKLIVDFYRKLIPWIEENFSSGSLLELVSGLDVDKLNLMAEVDLIDMKKHSVVVSTIHRAKGLQFETTIVPGVVDDRYPSYFSTKNNDINAIEEDARLLYVALSRPTDKLIVSYYKQSNNYPKKCSRFMGKLVADFDYVRL